MYFKTAFNKSLGDGFIAICCVMKKLEFFCLAFIRSYRENETVIKKRRYLMSAKLLLLKKLMTSFPFWTFWLRKLNQNSSRSYIANRLLLNNIHLKILSHPKMEVNLTGFLVRKALPICSLPRLRQELNNIKAILCKNVSLSSVF